MYEVLELTQVFGRKGWTTVRTKWRSAKVVARFNPRGVWGPLDERSSAVDTHHRAVLVAWRTAAASGSLLTDPTIATDDGP